MTYYQIDYAPSITIKFLERPSPVREFAFTDKTTNQPVCVNFDDRLLPVLMSLVCSDEKARSRTVIGTDVDNKIYEVSTTRDP